MDPVNSTKTSLGRNTSEDNRRMAEKKYKKTALHLLHTMMKKKDSCLSYSPSYAADVGQISFISFLTINYME